MTDPNVLSVKILGTAFYDQQNRVWAFNGVTKPALYIDAAEFLMIVTRKGIGRGFYYVDLSSPANTAELATLMDSYCTAVQQGRAWHPGLYKPRQATSIQILAATHLVHYICKIGPPLTQCQAIAAISFDPRLLQPGTVRLLMRHCALYSRCIFDHFVWQFSFITQDMINLVLETRDIERFFEPAKLLATKFMLCRNGQTEQWPTYDLLSRHYTQPPTIRGYYWSAAYHRNRMPLWLILRQLLPRDMARIVYCLVGQFESEELLVAPYPEPSAWQRLVHWLGW